MAGAYTEEELAELERAGERRTAVARMDIRQRHLTEPEFNQAASEGAHTRGL